MEDLHGEVHAGVGDLLEIEDTPQGLREGEDDLGVGAFVGNAIVGLFELEGRALL